MPTSSPPTTATCGDEKRPPTKPRAARSNPMARTHTLGAWPLFTKSTESRSRIPQRNPSQQKPLVSPRRFRSQFSNPWSTKWSRVSNEPAALTSIPLSKLAPTSSKSGSRVSELSPRPRSSAEYQNRGWHPLPAAVADLVRIAKSAAYPMEYRIMALCTLRTEQGDDRPTTEIDVRNFAFGRNSQGDQ